MDLQPHVFTLDKRSKLKAVYGKNQAQYISDLEFVQACGRADLIIVLNSYQEATIVDILCLQQTATICWN